MGIHGRLMLTVVAALAMASLVACSSGGDGGGGGSAPVAPSVTTASVAQGEVNQPYSASLAASGTGPFTWQLTNGPLPTGVTLQSSGALTGTPTQEGQFPFTVRVTGPGGTITKDLKLTTLGSTHRVSVVSSTSSTNPLGEANGDSGNHPAGRSSDPGTSNTGRFVVFDSGATNLVPNQNPGPNRQVYLHDRQTGVTEIVSVSSAGAPGNGDSIVATVSDDGDIVVFDSFADNLVANDTGGARDVFVRNRAAGTTQRISQLVNGSQAPCANINVDPNLCNSSDPSISADGTIVAFASRSALTADDDDDNLNDVFVFNRSTGSLQRISVGVGSVDPNGGSGSPAISADGLHVAFSSLANNLVAGDTVDSVDDIFVFDRQTGQLRKVSVVPGNVASNGSSFSPSLSGDGRFVAFWSEAENLLLPDGNGFADIFVADMQDNPATLKRLVNNTPQPGDSSFNGTSRAPSISRDGKIVAFDSEATNVDITTPDNNGVRDIYVLDRSCSTTFMSGLCTFKRASIASNGDVSNGESRFPALSGDGKYVTYFSDANNLVPFVGGDGNGVRDAFVTKP